MAYIRIYIKLIRKHYNILKDLNFLLDFVNDERKETDRPTSHSWSLRPSLASILTRALPPIAYWKCILSVYLSGTITFQNTSYGFLIKPSWIRVFMSVVTKFYPWFAYKIFPNSSVKYARGVGGTWTSVSPVIFYLFI